MEKKFHWRECRARRWESSGGWAQLVLSISHFSLSFRAFSSHEPMIAFPWRGKTFASHSAQILHLQFSGLLGSSRWSRNGWPFVGASKKFMIHFGEIIGNMVCNAIWWRLPSLLRILMGTLITLIRATNNVLNISDFNGLHGHARLIEFSSSN